MRRFQTWPTKLISYALTILALVTLAFLLPRALPGDPLAARLDTSSTTYLQDPAVRAAQAAYYGLDQPLIVQYGRYLRDLAGGDLGTSTLYRGTPVTKLLRDRAPWTALLIATAIIMAIVLGALGGVHSAWNRARPIDRRLLVIFVGIRSVPGFVLASLSLYLFCGRLGWFPLGGTSTVFANFGFSRWVVDVAHHLVMPASVLAVELAAGYYLLMRGGMVSQLGADYMVMGQAKGLPERRLKYGYAMRNSLLPVVALMGLHLGFAMTGAVFVERVFNYQGLGLLLVDAVAANDYATLQACFLVVAVAVPTASLLSELFSQRLDPRTKL